MKLELKHLAPYLPYDLRIECHSEEEIELKGSYISIVKGLHIGGVDDSYGNNWNLEVKPILRPISDLKKNEFPFKLGTYTQNFKFTLEDTEYQFIERMLELHFDIFGLIEKGLAIDINTLENN